MISTTTGPDGLAALLGLSQVLTVNQTGRLQGVQVTKEWGKPLTVDLRFAADGGGTTAARYVLRDKGWAQAGTAEGL